MYLLDKGSLTMCELSSKHFDLDSGYSNNYLARFPNGEEISLTSAASGTMYCASPYGSGRDNYRISEVLSKYSVYHWLF